MSISNIDRNKEPFVPQTVFSKPNRSGTVYQTTQQKPTIPPDSNPI